MKKALYYIQGVNFRGREVIALLESKGANPSKYEGSCTTWYYYIDIETNNIAYCDINSTVAKFLKGFGKELTLPKKSFLIYGDLDKTIGYYLNEDTLVKTGSKYKANFATENIAKSAQAAAMISQIRLQGVEHYGELVPYGLAAFTITNHIAKDDTSESHLTPEVSSYTYKCEGGLLRFENSTMARLFLKHNENLVKQYLKVF